MKHSSRSPSIEPAAARRQHQRDFLCRSTVLAEYVIDPDLIGGAVLQIGDRKIDASVQGRLRRLKTELAQDG